MRTSTQLRRIADLAETLRRERGDTEWTEADRSRVAIALDSLTAIGPPERRFSQPRTEDQP